MTEPGNGGGGGSGGGGDAPSGPVCEWVRGTARDVDVLANNSGTNAKIIRETAEDNVLLVWRCDGRWDGRTYKWLVPITALDLARDGLVELSGRLPAPAVVTTPGDGTPSIATVPVFVTVDPAQWAPIEVTRTDPLTGLSATAKATPTTMAVDPGDGESAHAGTTRCEGPGVGYDPGLDGGDPHVQATLPGRCTHTYHRITRNADGSDVAGRPDAWTLTVTVTWTVTWAATNGESGAFAPIPKAASVARPVTEVQVLVTA